MRGVFYWFQGSKKRSPLEGNCIGLQRTDFVSLGPDVQYDLQNAGEDDYQRIVSTPRMVLRLSLLIILLDGTLHKSNPGRRYPS